MKSILIGRGEQPVVLLGKYGNRHGLVTGSTGTGKTISVMMLAEGFSRMGVPVAILPEQHHRLLASPDQYRFHP